MLLKKCCKFQDQLNHNFFLIIRESVSERNLHEIDNYYINPIWFCNRERKLLRNKLKIKTTKGIEKGF